jgi:hypothetical protein
MNILQQAANRIGLPSERVFGDAYSFFEVRRSKKYICNKFLDYAYNESKIPDEPVKAYCLYILADRITRQPTINKE